MIKDSYEMLIEIDPKLMNKIHPHDSKRIKTYLTMYEKNNIIPSEFIKKNQIGQLRFKNCLIFWPKIKSQELLY